MFVVSKAYSTPFESHDPFALHRHGQGNRGAAYSGHHIKFNPETIADALDWAQKQGPPTTREDGVATVIFHELTHYTRYGRDLDRLYPRGNEYGPVDEERETWVNSGGRAAAHALGQNFICAIFANGGN
jgi:predicted SprT family Zn-dependent metalloprotease